MKHIFAFILAAITTVASATTQVPIVWPFAPGSNQANAIRMTIEQANKAQSKYQFVFENKPGAGGVVAVNYVLNSPKPAILYMSTSFFVRPMFYPLNESWDVNAFEPVAIAATGSPLVLLSKNVSSIEDIRKKAQFTIGMSNGSITEVVARKVQEALPGVKVLLVPYPNTIAATRDMMGGHVDASVEFFNDAMPWVDSNAAKVVAITGSKNQQGFVTFKSQGVAGLDSVLSNFYMLMSNKTSPALVQELHEILDKAAATEEVTHVWRADLGTTGRRTLEMTQKFWNLQVHYWRPRN